MIAVFSQTGPWGCSHSIPVYKCLSAGFEEQSGGEDLLDCLFIQKMTHRVWFRHEGIPGLPVDSSVLNRPVMWSAHHCQATDPYKDIHCQLENQGQSFILEGKTEKILPLPQNKTQAAIKKCERIYITW